MQGEHFTPRDRLTGLVSGIFSPPAGGRRIAVSLAYGMACHSIFALAVISMIAGMFFGVSRAVGQVPAPWSIFANAALLLQFPLAHSILLTGKGGGFLAKLAPRPFGGTLATTTYAIIASVQLLALFALWTPSGVIWWRAEGWALAVICMLYAFSWLLLIKASYDAGAEIQSGALGWMSLMKNVKPIFPGMPVSGLFRFIRQPIYISFALTLWTVPVWTPDQLAVAVTLTAYCLLAPVLKERRFKARYGKEFESYKKRVPYAVPFAGKENGNG